MKKLLAFLTALVLLAGTAAAYAEDDYLSIQQMRESAPERWTQTFETKWRDIAIDAEIRVPQVDALPVVLVSGGATQPTLTAEETGWDYIEYRGPYDVMFCLNDAEYPKSVNGVRVGDPVSKGVWYSDFDPQNTYAPMDDTPFGEIVAQAQEKIAQFGYDPEAFDLEHPCRLWAHHIYDVGTKEDLLPGYFFLNARVKVCGIPVLSHIWQAVKTQSDTHRIDEIWHYTNASLCYDGYRGGISSIFLTPLAVQETLADDIPLCSFDKVLSAVEAEVTAGHIRKVYEMELGYVLYNEPGVYRPQGASDQELENAYQSARYYLKPMWQINCLYVENSKGKLQETASCTDDERNSSDYRELLVDAQTGELVQPNTEKERCEFMGFLFWEDAR